jgi:Flp pilus assembly protein CpaB
MRRWLVTLLGIVMMGASIYGYGRYAEMVETKAATVEAIWPSRLIASGEMVEASMLRRVAIPVGAMAADVLREESAIVGRVAVVPIGPNEGFADWKLADVQVTPREGERYVTFPTDDVTNVGNMIRKGDRVDVWVEFDRPVLVGGVYAGTVKVIEGLAVANVRTAEGVEVTDVSLYDTAFASTARQQQRVRNAAVGKPSMNTYIMNEGLYKAYTLAGLTGRIKLALPDLSLPEHAPARVSETFLAFASALAFEGGEKP